MDDNYIKMMFGENAQHAAFNYVVQDAGDNRAAILGNTSFASQMSFGGSKDFPHVLVLCDVIIRPHLVIGSNHLVGSGATGILTGALGDVDNWLDNGKVLINNIKK